MLLQDKRKAVLDKFYTSFDVQSLNEVVADDLKFFESDKLQPYGKKGKVLNNISVN